MKKTLLLLLCLSFLLCACGKAEPAAESTAAAEENVEESIVESKLDPMAMIGDYGDSTGQRAHMTVLFDEEAEIYRITVDWANSADSYSEWYMTAADNGDGKLHYTDCANDLVTVADSGEAQRSAVSEGKEGYFTFVDGVLAWDGAADESCRSCTFEKLPGVEAEMPPAEEPQIGLKEFVGIWKYDNYGGSLRVDDCGAYYLYDAQGSWDGIVRFCRFLPEVEGLALFNEYGGEDCILTIVHGEDGDYLTDPAGDTLHPGEFPMNTTANCMVTSYFLEGDLLTIMEEEQVWLSDWDVQDLGPGSELRLNSYFSEVIETMDMISDTEYRINQTMTLRFNADRDAWQLLDHPSESWSYKGVCRITDSTEFINTVSEDASLADILAVEDMHVILRLTVSNGEAAAVEILDIY